MAIAYERNTNLAYNTEALRDCGRKYAEIAKELRTLAKNLNRTFYDLQEKGWTTPAGTTFYELTQTNWEENVEMYADLLDTLKACLDYAADRYDRLTVDHIESVLS